MKSIVEEILSDVTIPRVVKVKQTFDRPKVKDVANEVHTRLEKTGLLSKIRPGQTIAIGVGSRGIANLPLIVKTILNSLTTIGAIPFIIPAMGSHGNATSEGQRRVLEQLGITEELMGVPIFSSMDTVKIGSTASGLPVHIDKLALGADWIGIVNRVKLHTTFRGKFESGLMKMIVIGLGKQAGAAVCHNLGSENMAQNILSIGKEAIKKINLLFAVGIIENAYHETAAIEVFEKNEIEEMEPHLLEQARKLHPRIPFKSFDVLIIDEIGKNISGTGFDTNVAGRFSVPSITGGPTVKRIVVLDITDQSKGNGNGLGIADFSTLRAYEKFDFLETYPNPLTSTVLLSAKIPMILDNDNLAIKAAIQTSNAIDKSQVEMVRIKNTLSLEEFEISESLIPKTKEKHLPLEIISDPYELPFDLTGNLCLKR